MSSSKRIIRENIVFNVCKTMMSVLYPILSFTYVARVISVEGLGAVSFAKNFVSYFCLLASLGIGYYGTREGARLVNDKKKFSKLFWEILCINLISTTLSVIAFMIAAFCVPTLENYRLLLLINAISIILGGLSNEWVLGAVEKYKFISLRTMLTQVLCVIAMFLLIREEADYITYAILLVVAGYGPFIFNWIYVIKKQLVEKVDWKILELKKHLKPIFILFAMLISIDLYTLLDTTMLGIIQGDRAVGIYSAAIKVPRLVNSMIASVGAVLVPRLSYYYENERDKFNKLIDLAMTYIFMITIPCAIGEFGMAEEIILLICGNKYIDSVITSRILSVITMIIPISVLFNNQIFIPMRKEIYVLKSTCAGAVVNIILNSLLIPRMAENGAAIGTVCAEFTVMCICVYHVKKELKIKGMGIKYLNRLAVALLIIPIILLTKIFIDNSILRLVIAILMSGIVWGVLSFPMIKKLLAK